LQLETEGNLKILQIKNENWTITNLISRFCYILTKGNIKFITSSSIHPETEIGVLKIIHPEYLKLIHDAIVKIKEELLVVKKAF
jgi:DNA-directed RNA polymerase subunit L